MFWLFCCFLSSGGIQTSWANTEVSLYWKTFAKMPNVSPNWSIFTTSCPELVALTPAFTRTVHEVKERVYGSVWRVRGQAPMHGRGSNPSHRYSISLTSELHPVQHCFVCSHIGIERGRAPRCSHKVCKNVLAWVRAPFAGRKGSKARLWKKQTASSPFHQTLHFADSSNLCGLTLHFTWLICCCFQLHLLGHDSTNR